MKKKIVLYLLLLTSTIEALATPNEDPLLVATLLVYDGEIKRAKEQLARIELNDPNVDKFKYYRLQGVIQSKLDHPKEAAIFYEKAIEALKNRPLDLKRKTQKQKHLFSIGTQQTEKLSQAQKYQLLQEREKKIQKLYLFAAKGYYGAKDCQKTLKMLQKAKEAAKQKPSLFLLKSECNYKLKRYGESLQALQEGIERFANGTKLYKQKIYLLANLDLYQAAMEASREYMRRFGASVKEYLLLAQMLLRSNQRDLAIEVLEEGRMLFPKDEKIAILLGSSYLQKGMHFAAAHIFDELAKVDRKHLKEAVQTAKQAGEITHALYLNSMVADKKEKLKQKIAIYLGAKEFEKIVALKKEIDRYGLLEDENLRYTLAYAYYMIGDYENAQKELRYINDSELFKKATVIRANIEKCMQDAMECI